MGCDEENDQPPFDFAALRLRRFSSRPSQKWCRRTEGSEATRTPPTCFTLPSVDPVSVEGWT